MDKSLSRIVKTLTKGQIDLVKAVENYYRVNNHGLVVAPTGYGKTFCMMKCLEMLPFKKVLVIQHRDELVEQNSNEAMEVLPNWKVTKYNDYSGDICFTMNLSAVNRVDQLIEAKFDFIIVDEAHHVSMTGKSYIVILEKLHINSLGFTATPKIKGRSMGWWQDVIFSKDINDAIEEGRLVPAKMFSLMRYKDQQKYREVELKYKGDVMEIAKDIKLSQIYQTQEFAKYMFLTWYDLAGSKKTIVFCNKRITARFLCDYFTENGIKSCYVDADNKQGIQDFKDNKYQVCFNIHVLTEGFDSTDIECVVLASQVKDECAFIQSCGRGLRLHEGKEYCTIIDYGFSAEKHGTFTVVPIILCQYLDKCEKPNISGYERCKCCNSWLHEPRICEDKECRYPSKTNASECESCGFIFEIKEDTPKGEGEYEGEEEEPKDDNELELEELDFCKTHNKLDDNKLITFPNKFAVKLNGKIYSLSAIVTDYDEYDNPIYENRAIKVKSIRDVRARDNRQPTDAHLNFYCKQVIKSKLDCGRVNRRDFWQIQSALTVLTGKVTLS